MEPVDPDRLSGHNDPETSRKAALANPYGRANQCQIMLKAHGDTAKADRRLYFAHHGLICDEAWLAAGATLPTNSCHHHRHSSLADDYLPALLRRVRLGPDGRGPNGRGPILARTGHCGLPREVFVMTPEGLDYYEAHLEFWTPPPREERARWRKPWEFGEPPYIWRY